MEKLERNDKSIKAEGGVTVHIPQLFCGVQDVSQEEPCSYLLSATGKQVCASV